jgi:hypothetical protein
MTLRAGLPQSRLKIDKIQKSLHAGAAGIGADGVGRWVQSCGCGAVVASSE